MTKLDKSNLEEFLSYYHGLHDSTISNINYNVLEARIELLIDVYWSGVPILKDDGYYETNKKKMKMVFNGVEKYSNKEIFLYDFIFDVYIDYIKIDNKEFICFASSESDPFIYIVCDSIEYEEI